MILTIAIVDRISSEERYRLHDKARRDYYKINYGTNLNMKTTILLSFHVFLLLKFSIE